ncbi:MAG TPA: helicase [Chloroflexus aurantiacus]|jgi:hypothetical protein|uniref:Helicase domain protein n=1 Tax=Chloroflexus aurantiacus (strain ATCC 29366 / DSM 635 / J-10-fl) TaxID=324602 RepID=A9WFD4_CHLAA|nr:MULTISPECIES: DISARM system helicase DrmA [Chloroflexus]ABY36118.1 helicase domain protein [Chloroflexus aurantiacus J-10-fl]GIV91334.1 MAG: helicase [Chloroflexus sp.]HBW66434.1 helicase [Chloroflexus aurantiacus]
MNIRDELLTALVREILGPRNGRYEILPQDEDPRQEYITGVLEPRNARSQDERIEDQVDQVIEETSSEEDQDNQGFVAATGMFSPALDPRALPRSIGLSFTVKAAQGDPYIEICITWARYLRNTDKEYERKPEMYLSGPVNATLDSQSFMPDKDIRLLVRSRRVEDSYRISIFLVNERIVPEESRPQTEDYLFQPQIRVHLSAGTHLIPVQIAETESTLLAEETREEESLALQYRHRTALARGHMCAAIWKEIDPEKSTAFERPAEAPFAWTDAEIVPETERAKFSPADVRTELVPIYLVQSPDISWNTSYGPSPELRAEVLAETWQPEALRAALQPLVNGYRAWITEQERAVPTLDGNFQMAAQRNLEECQRTATRIQEAIDVLCTNEDARLAFCFANKAIAMQAGWKHRGQTGGQFTWRPFQLAFIMLNIPPLVNPLRPDRETCDLLWFPTGGGKTEAYLGLTAFLLGLRRLVARRNRQGDTTGGGVAVLSRYTLRLLTIQQFRRALGVITACEILRVWGLKDNQPAGWRPQACLHKDDFLWGGVRFSAGLWVGGGVTPNQLRGFGFTNAGNSYSYIPGALDILKGIRQNQKNASYVSQGEPAQVTQCPVCGALLAVPEEGLGEGSHTLYLTGMNLPPTAPINIRHPKPKVKIENVRIRHFVNTCSTLVLQIRIEPQEQWKAEEVDTYVWNMLQPLLGANAAFQAARPSRPGYYIISVTTQRNSSKDIDFEIFCPNPDCELNQHAWAEQVPLPRESRTVQWRGQVNLRLAAQRESGLPLSDDMDWQDIPEPFREAGYQKRSRAIPVPAFTVDDQIYARCPSLVISTVDKFARLAYEGEAAALFGNVTHYHARYGYYRQGNPADHLATLPKSNRVGYFRHPSPEDACVQVEPFAPPDLILQDELHLIEGPLGSMVGIYETAVDYLCQRVVNGSVVRPKYIASTATVRRADPQVKALFNRSLAQFPPPALSADDRFFAVTGETHPLDATRPGRLYVGVCAPGKGAQTPIVRIWSALLQCAEDLRLNGRPDNELDPFWTLVGYFNALRELAGTLSLYRQDIPEWLKHRSSNRRNLDEYQRVELSSRSKSTELPNLLRRLETALPSPSTPDAVFATSMFGTGVDVDRLSLMVVHGQPKTTSAYIQATGRVGRRTCGLVITSFRATRPRDLDHYEFFTGYHRGLYRHVEPVTVAPFSPRARERALGPVAVILLRLARQIGGVDLDELWRVEQRISSKFFSGAHHMRDKRYAPEVKTIPGLFEERAQNQPSGRRPAPGDTEREANSELDRWRMIAEQHSDPDEFVYSEPAVIRAPRRHVVLGDSQHLGRFEVAFENAPQSLRDIEETTMFED